MSNQDKNRRIFCVGLDGGTWTILQSLMQAGHMPQLSRLAQAGISGVLHSTIPPITPAAWSTFMTGCNPGKHGIFDFQGYDREQHRTYFVNATSLRMPTLWQLLSRHNKRVAVVDLPVTYPPPQINGVIISGLMTPSRASTFTHPAALLRELETHLGYEWPLLKEEDEHGRIQADFDGFLRKMQLFLTSRVEAMLYLLQHEIWDFAFLQLQAVDFLQHALWKYLDDSHPAYHEKRHQQVIHHFFKPLDHALGELFSLAKKTMGEDTLIVVLSDHGFQRHNTRAELNHWLFANGFLTPQSRRNGMKKNWMRHAGLIRKLDVLQLRKRLLPKSKRRELGGALRMQSIDHGRSLAYAVSAFWGYVYLGPNATDSDISNLKNRLGAWRDPQTQQPVVKNVFRRDEVFHGAALDRMPDLIVEPMPGYTFSSKTYFNDARQLEAVAHNDFHVGTHASEGIFVLAGPEIVRGETWQEHQANLQDMMPTLLHWLVLPVPDDCDGVVRREWFDKQRNGHDVIFAPSTVEMNSEVMLSDEEQREIERRLHTLGYI